MTRVPNERLQSHLSVGEAWSAMRSLTAVEVQQVVEELVAIRAGKLWRCFHCGDEFTDEAEAREHFGDTMDDEPICQVTAERYRTVERELVAYQNESDATARTFYDIGHRAAVAERDAEQKGYDRGIADAKAHPGTLDLATRKDIARIIEKVPAHPSGERMRYEILDALRGLFDPNIVPEPERPTITQGDIDMAKHFAREAFFAGPDDGKSLDRALSKMVECLKP